MRNATYAALAAAGIWMGLGGAAHAICTNAWADVTITCPQPVPYNGRTATFSADPNVRPIPTVGTPGLYPNYGTGYTVRVYRYGNGTGYQPLPWQK